MPTVTICSSHFVALGHREAEVLGIAALPIVETPHPVAGLSAEQVKERAEDLIAEISRLLTTSRETITDEYHEIAARRSERVDDDAQPGGIEHGDEALLLAAVAAKRRNIRERKSPKKD